METITLVIGLINLIFIVFLYTKLAEIHSAINEQLKDIWETLERTREEISYK